MISRVRGTVAAQGADSLVVDVGGVGLQVFVPASLVGEAGRPGQEITLHTHLQVRENDLTLYGFATEEQLGLFCLLLGVQGVGPRVAMSILSHLTPDRLRTAIAQEDAPTLSRVPGIGPKTAKKLLFDLKDKVATALAEAPPPLRPADTDLIAALTGLGYSVVEAQTAIASLPPEDLPLEERLRLALAYFASG
jgi:Holliday junction DNA helicase RuvA